MPAPDPNPYCLDLEWRGDFKINPDGSLKLVSGQDKAGQRIIRRLYTGARIVTADGTLLLGELKFAQDYGVGCGRLIGEPFGADFAAQFTQKVKAAVLVDESVDSTQDPIVEYYQDKKSIFGSIKVFLLNNQQMNIVVPLQKVA